MLITNWGRTDSKTGDEMRFWLCPDCGRHLPHDPESTAHARAIQSWRENHNRLWSGEPVQLILAYQFQADCLVMSVPSQQDTNTIGRSSFSPTLVTLAEALLAGAASLLELESNEIAAFPRLSAEGDATQEIVFYETVPGGAGYVEEMARRLLEVAEAGRQRLYGHECMRACYLCLKHYSNQRWHPFFDKDRVRDLLLTLSSLTPVEPIPAPAGAGVRRLREELGLRRRELEGAAERPGCPGPQSPIESLLLEALLTQASLPQPVVQHEVKDGERLVTVPDFAYPELRIAVFCDGFAYHGNPDTLELDARKRNWLQEQGWIVLTFWGKTIMRDPGACAREILSVYQQRKKAS